MIESKIENVMTYSHKEKNERYEWGKQWDEHQMSNLLNLGAYKFFKKMVEERAKEPCLILGASSEDHLVGSYYKKIIGVNIAKEEFHATHSHPTKYEFVACDAENLPFKNSAFRNIISKSFLHHVDPIRELKEIKRVMEDDGFLFLLEPGKFNPAAAVGRKFFPTNLHVKSEKPFNPYNLKKVVLREFGQIKYEGYFHTFSVMIPIIAKHVKLFKSKKILNIVEKIDYLLSNSFLRQFCWLIVLGAVKDDDQKRNSARFYQPNNS